MCKIVNSHIRYDEVGASHIGNKQGNNLDRFTHSTRKEALRGWLGSAYKDPPHFILHEDMKSCKRTGDDNTLTANMPPFHTLFSCFFIQNRLSCWKGSKVTFRLCGCGVFLGSMIGMVFSRSPQTSFSSGCCVCSATVAFSASMEASVLRKAISTKCSPWSICDQVFVSMPVPLV